MEVQLFKNKLTDALLSLYMYFLKMQGVNVTYEDRNGKMSGGALLDETVYAMYLTFFFIIVITNIFPPDSKELGTALDLAVSAPHNFVEELIADNPDEIDQTRQLIEYYGLQYSENLVSKIEGNITTTVNKLFKDKNSKNAIVDVMIGVAANAMNTIIKNDIEFNYENTDGRNTGKHLKDYLDHLNLKNTSSVTRYHPMYKGKRIRTLVEKPEPVEDVIVGMPSDQYIENYDNTVQATNEKKSPYRKDIGIISTKASTLSAEIPLASEVKQTRLSPLAQRLSFAANKRSGGSKTRGQKRKIVESKRRRGGSKKQKRRSHKRR